MLVGPPGCGKTMLVQACCVSGVDVVLACPSLVLKRPSLDTCGGYRCCLSSPLRATKHQNQQSCRHLFQKDTCLTRFYFDNLSLFSLINSTQSVQRMCEGRESREYVGQSGSACGGSCRASLLRRASRVLWSKNQRLHSTTP